MSAATVISTCALQPSIGANTCFAAGTFLGAVGGKLLSALQALTSAVAAPLILAVGLLEALLRACKCDDLEIIANSLERTGELALLQVSKIIPSIATFIVGRDTVVCRKIIFDSFVALKADVKAAGLYVRTGVRLAPPS